MTANKLLQKLATIYRGDEIQYPELRAVTLAQWMLESGRATSRLAKLHYNFGGIKWRREMAPYATKNPVRSQRWRRLLLQVCDHRKFHQRILGVSQPRAVYRLGGARRHA
jgi:hypothetical protein